MGQNSDLHSNSLLHAVIYPDSTDPADPFSGTDNVRFEYNRQGQITKKTDQAGTVHEYVFDKLGREVQDRVTALGSGVDGSVRRIEHTYKSSGELEKVTCYDAATNGQPVNQVKYTHDIFQQVVAYQQEHNGTVDAQTPEVAYTYADGSNNDKRTLSVIYPDLREIDFDYGTSGSDDDLLSRFGGLEDAGGSLVKYTYFGVDTFCEQEYPENAVKLTYIDSGATGDPYTGLDRFGRVIDQRWHKGTTELERLDYTYSRLGNRTERDNTVAATGQDEEYTYDGLYRLGNMGRGTFTSGTLNKDFEQDWGGACPVLAGNPLGNWKNFKQGDGSSWNLDQTRAHTKANEIEKIDNDANVMSHDPAGNITKSPRPGNWSGTYDYTWDAWNRLVAVTARGTNIAFAYDGQHKRITKTASGITRHFYYSVDWQILEERLDEETEPLRQYVWNPNPDRMDDLVLRDEGAEGSGSSSSGTQQRLYAINDLMNVTAIVDDDGNVVERYGYTPFGESRVMDASFGPRSSSDYDWELRYKTYPLDLESGLFQVRFRYLHPGLGRWMSRDPLYMPGGLSEATLAWLNRDPANEPGAIPIWDVKKEGDMGEELNLYAFVGDNPVNVIDYFGLSPNSPGSRMRRRRRRREPNLSEKVVYLCTGVWQVKCSPGADGADCPDPVEGRTASAHVANRNDPAGQGEGFRVWREKASEEAQDAIEACEEACDCGVSFGVNFSCREEDWK